MMVALHLHEQSIHKCGIPAQIGMSPDALTQVTLEEDHCFACATLEEDQKSSGDVAPGTVKYMRLRDQD